MCTHMITQNLWQNYRHQWKDLQRGVRLENNTLTQLCVNVLKYTSAITIFTEWNGCEEPCCVHVRFHKLQWRRVSYALTAPESNLAIIMSSTVMVTDFQCSTFSVLSLQHAHTVDQRQNWWEFLISHLVLYTRIFHVWMSTVRNKTFTSWPAFTSTRTDFLIIAERNIFF